MHGEGSRCPLVIVFLCSVACDGVLPSGMSDMDGLRGTSASTPIESDMVGEIVEESRHAGRLCFEHTIFQDHSVGQHAAVELRRTVPHSVNEVRRL